MNNLSHIIVLYAVVFSMFMPASVWAFSLSPMSANLSSSGGGSSKVFIVDNKGGEVPIAVEMQIFGRSMTEQGVDVLVEVDGDFVVYPSQVVIMPGESQSVRLQYIGPRDMVDEQAYRFIAEQLPIDLGGETTGDGFGVKMVFRYVASVYVLPKGLIGHDVKITDAYIKEGEVDELILIVKNEGTKHRDLSGVKLTLKSSSSSTLGGRRKLTQDSEQVDVFQGVNILAGHSRVIKLTAPAGLPAGALDAVLHY